MSDYKYDIFVSYRRMSEEWVRWTRENFCQTLRTFLLPGISKISIFLDEQIEKRARRGQPILPALMPALVC